MLKWDAAGGAAYAAKSVEVLKGGYENFLMSFPMKVVDAAKGREGAARERKRAKGEGIPSASLVSCNSGMRFS